MKKSAFDRDLIRSEYEKVWGSHHMVDYCTKKVAAAAMLPGGEIIPVEKRQIETRFCFGESGYDYAEAVSASEFARKSESYFRTENMREFEEAISALTESMTGSGDRRVVIGVGPKYYRAPKDSRIHGWAVVRPFDIRRGGGVSPENTIVYYGSKYRFATQEEQALILEAYKTAAAEHAKKVDAYLKRYGMSKVRTWTYWRDA